MPKILTEYSSLCNRFAVAMVFDNHFNLSLCTPAWVRYQLAHHPLAHGLLVLLPNFDLIPQAYIFNADGSYGGFSGNGARIIAHILMQKHQSKEVNFQLGSQQVRAWQEGNLIASVHAVGMNEGAREIEISGYGPVLFHFISTGNPHALFIGKQTTDIFYQEAPYFISSIAPQGINLSMIHCLGENVYTLTTFERGVGPTPACSSAAIALATILSPTPQEVIIHMAGGELRVERREQEIILKAPIPCTGSN